MEKYVRSSLLPSFFSYASSSNHNVCPCYHSPGFRNRSRRRRPPHILVPYFWNQGYPRINSTTPCYNIQHRIITSPYPPHPTVPTIHHTTTWGTNLSQTTYQTCPLTHAGYNTTMAIDSGWN
jgi:hypothetical protein